MRPERIRVQLRDGDGPVTNEGFLFLDREEWRRFADGWPGLSRIGDDRPWEVRVARSFDEFHKVIGDLNVEGYHGGATFTEQGPTG